MNSAADLLPAYFHLMNLNGAAHVYREAVRSGLFDALESGPKTAEEVAQACGLVARPIELMLEALVALALVSNSGDQYRLTPLASMLLAGSYRNLGDEYWAHLPALLKTGQPLVRVDDLSRSEAFYQAQAAVLGWMLRPAAECAAALLAESLPPDAAVLDLGAGSGIWGLALASRLPGATVTAVDWPAVLEVAAETAQDFGLTSRLQTIAGNLHDVALPGSQFDLAIIANVTHLLTPEGNRGLFQRARCALKAHGRVAIVDVFAGQAQGELNRTLYAIGLALRTEHGRVYLRPELETLLAAAGFGNSQLFPLSVPPFAVGVLIAEAG